MLRWLLALILICPTAVYAQDKDGQEEAESVTRDQRETSAFVDAASAGSKSNEGNETRRKSIQSIEDDAKTYQDILELPPVVAPYDDLGLEDVIPPDERKKISPTTSFPARATVLITMSGGRCSGWLYGKNIVATAGHCVHSGGSNGKWHSKFRVYAGRDGSNSPFGSCGWRKLYSVKGWTRNRDKNYDYGAIKLDCDIGDRVGWYGYYWVEGSLNGTPSIISGYPGDKPLTQWQSTDKVQVTHALKVFYKNDTAPGMSGSPAYHKHPRYGWAAFGIHTNGRHNGAPWRTHNAATRITKARFENMQRWRKEN